MNILYQKKIKNTLISFCDFHKMYIFTIHLIIRPLSLPIKGRKPYLLSQYKISYSIKWDIPLHWLSYETDAFIKWQNPWNERTH